MSNSHLAPLSDEEAKKEHDDIQEEIAKDKGLKTESKEDEKPDIEADKKEKKEPIEKEDSEPDADDAQDSDADGVKDKGEEVPPKRNPRLIPLSKFQSLKKELREVSEAKDKEINQLKADLETAKTSKDVGVVIKEFATKHNVSEEQAKDMLEMVKAFLPKPDPSKEGILTKAEALIKKQEAKDAFDTEFAELIKDVPEAADKKEDIQAKAYEDGNLNKSLFEIYHRNFNKPDTTPVRKKTGEVTRGPASTRHSTSVFDVKDIASRLSKGESGVLKGLTDKQIDEVFEYGEKHGSNFQS